MEAKPEIFEYTDYRAYLRDLYQFQKESTRYFSYRYFSKKAGFKSPNYLKLVIEGDRNISDNSIERFAQALSLNKKESDFFTRLVNFNQAATSKEKADFALKIIQSKIYQRLHPLSKEQMYYYQRWYQIGVRELCLCGKIKNDPQWIAELFHGSVKSFQIRQAIDSLLKLGLLSINSNNELIPREQNLMTLPEVLSPSVVSYHKEMMERAKDSIDEISAMEREISSICVPISQETMQKMKMKIQDFKKEMIALASNDKEPDQVYQLNFQFFPITKKVDTK